MTALLSLLTVALGMASLASIARSARPLLLFFVRGRAQAAGEAYGRGAEAAGMTAATVLSAGWWELAVPFAVAAAVLGVLWWRTAP